MHNHDADSEVCLNRQILNNSVMSVKCELCTYYNPLSNLVILTTVRLEFHFEILVLKQL
jgi:hypothetical protein